MATGTRNQDQLLMAQMAHVVGPVDEEIYCDEWGRVKASIPLGS